MSNLLKLLVEYKTLIVVFCAAFILQGCATMDQDDCLSADWAAIGEKDGARGQKESVFQSRSKACEKHGVTADLSAYKDGYNAGVRDFCVPSNGYKRGIDKLEYYYICPADLQAPFLKEYVKGLNFAISQIDLESRELDIDYRSAEVGLKGATTEDDKKSAEKRLRYIDTSRNSLRNENDKLRAWMNSALDQM